MNRIISMCRYIDQHTKCRWIFYDVLQANLCSKNINKIQIGIQYLPFGELFISQRNSTFDSRYKFTAKELDNETNYTYFGARYYDSDISIWLSVDPLAGKYPSLSPYAYCANNPIIYIDPDGRNFDWFQSESGATIWQDSNAESITIDGETYKNIGTTVTVNQGAINYHYVQNTPIGITDAGTNFGEFMQNDNAYRAAIDVASNYSQQTVKDVYMQRFYQGREDMYSGTLKLMGGILSAVLAVETAVVIYIGIEGLVAAGGVSVARGGASLVDDVAMQTKNWLGKDYKCITNKAGDQIFMSKDGLRKIRFDIKNFQGDAPHIHLEIFKNGKWHDAIQGTHRIYPKP